MPGDLLRYAPYNNMAPQDSAARPHSFRPSRFASGINYHQQPPQQGQQQRLQSPALIQDHHISVEAHHMAPLAPGYALDARSQSQRGWDYSSPVSSGYSFFT